MVVVMVVGHAAQVMVPVGRRSGLLSHAGEHGRRLVVVVVGHRLVVRRALERCHQGCSAADGDDALGIRWRGRLFRR